MAAKKTAKKVKTIEEVLASINKKAGAEIVHYGLSKRTYKRIPFTSPRMNYCTYGGLPTGRLIEFSGEEHGGKTTSALDSLGNYQQLDERDALIVDAENTLDPEWAEKLGVDLDRCIILQPETESAEELLDMALDFLRTGSVGFGILDSIGALISMEELEKGLEDAVYAGISKPLTRFAKESEMLCKKFDATFIGINQLRDDIGARWAGATKTVGGRGWRHLCTVRMEFRRGEFIDERGEVVKKSSESPAGNRVYMSMDKNKTCPQNRRGGYYTINYNMGIDYLVDLVEVAFKYDIIQQAGAWYTIIDPDTGDVLSDKIQGLPKVYDYLRDEENEEVLKFVEDFIDSKI